MGLFIASIISIPTAFILGLALPLPLALVLSFVVGCAAGLLGVYIDEG